LVLYFTNTPVHRRSKETAMNASRPVQTSTTTTVPSSDRRVVPFVKTYRFGPPERDFGIGYGKSSGYGTSRSYVSQPWAQPHFRFA
jgi:hypothetical protein